jgi:hypothetical protein
MNQTICPCPCWRCVALGPTGPTGAPASAPSYFFSTAYAAPTYFTLPIAAVSIPFNKILATSPDDSYDVTTSTYRVPASGIYRFEWSIQLDYQGGRAAGTYASFTLTTNSIPTATSFESLPANASGGGYDGVTSFYEGFFEAGSKVSLSGLNTDTIARVRVIFDTNCFSGRSLF